MEYRTLENIDSICIYEAFTQAFSDYQVSVDMSFKSFETMLKRNGFMPAVSVGAFVDKTLVAFILNGVREWDMKKTVYDLGTGSYPCISQNRNHGGIIESGQCYMYKK